MEPPSGTIIFTTVGRPHFGFDIFSVNLDSNLTNPTEHRFTDGKSINFNAQFVDDNQTIVFISERSGSPKIYLTRSDNEDPEPLHSVPGSLFHDRPIIKNGQLYFISAHERPDKLFTGWAALYSTRIHEKQSPSITRITPYGSVDYSPAISQSGRFMAVASYGSRPWGGEFHALNTDIVAFEASDTSQRRVVVCERGGWPTWSGDSKIYFHRQADDGWWSIFQVAFSPENFENFTSLPNAPIRVTPKGVHCFTPAAMHDGRRVVVATRRRDKNFRHIEIFDSGSNTFQPVTEKLNPNFHHYNPFASPDSGSIGYHRFRGEATQGELTIPHLDSVTSPVNQLRMLRLNGAFPAFSPSGEFVAFNHDFDTRSGLKIVASDGSKRWTLLKNRVAFYNSWSPTEDNVIYTSLGPIFESVNTTVQIARISFDISDLKKDDSDDVSCEIKILTRHDTGNNAFPSCSPDGKQLVFRSGRSGHKNLYILDAINDEVDGGGLRQLTEGAWVDTMPSWSPKGDLIAFSSNMHNPENVNAFSIYVIKPDGSDLKRVHVASSEVDRERINHVCFSEDGEWLLFTANFGGVTAEPVSGPNQFQPYGDLYVVNLDGSGLRRLTWNGMRMGHRHGALRMMR